MRTQLLVAALVIACNGDRSTSRPPTPMPTPTSNSNWPKAELELELDVTHKLTMGYGHVWEATVRRVIKGQLPDRVFALSTSGSDIYGGHFQCCGAERGVIVQFARIPERPAALTGFVAEDGTVWTIVDVGGS